MDIIIIWIWFLLSSFYLMKWMRDFWLLILRIAHQCFFFHFLDGPLSILWIIMTQKTISISMVFEWQINFLFSYHCIRRYKKNWVISACIQSNFRPFFLIHLLFLRFISLFKIRLMLVCVCVCVSECCLNWNSVAFFRLNSNQWRSYR